MSLDAWQPRRPQRMAFVGLFGTAIMVPVFLVDVARHGGDLTAWPVVIALVTLVGLAAMAWLRGLHRRPVDTEVTLYWYAWSAGAIAVVTAVVANAGGDPRRYGLVYGTIIATQAAVYPARGQALLITLAGLSYSAVMWPVVPLPDILLQLAMFAVMGVLVAAVSSDLHRAHAAEEAARRAAEHRTSLAATLSKLTAIELDDVSEAIIAALGELGFDVVQLAFVEPDGLALVRSRGADGSVLGTSSLERGVAGAALSASRTVTTEDHGIITGDGSVGAALATPIFVDSQVLGVLFAGRSEVGELEPQLVETVELLAAQAGRALGIAKLIEAERESVRRLTELDAMKSDFVSNVSHELRTPLTVIRGLGETMETRWAALSESGLGPELVARMNANAERLESVITGLLDFSRFQAGATVVERRTVDLATLGRDVVGRMEPLFEGRELEVSLDRATVQVDPSLLEHVLENLLVNALRHTPEGTPVTLAARVDANEVWVAVADDGPGIPADDLDRLTERFFQGDGDGAGGGIGLGLALCQQILHAHGTELEITSAEGAGAQFAFRLPRASVRAASVRHGSDAASR